MELASYLKQMTIKATVEWAPRTTNRETDALANGNTHDFNPELRIHVDPEMGRKAEFDAQ